MQHFLGIEIKNFQSDKKCYIAGFKYVATRLYKGTCLLSEEIFEGEDDVLSALDWEERVLKFDDNHINRVFLEKVADDLNNIVLNEKASNNMYRVTKLYKVKKMKVGEE